MPAPPSHRAATAGGAVGDPTDRFESGGGDGGYAGNAMGSSSSRRYMSSRRNSLSALPPHDSKQYSHYENGDIIRSASGSHLKALEDQETSRTDPETFYRNSGNRYKSMPSQGRHAALAASASLAHQGYVPNGTSYRQGDHFDQQQSHLADSNFARNSRRRKSVLRSLRKWVKKSFTTSKSAPDGFNDDYNHKQGKQRSSTYTGAYPPRPWDRSVRSDQSERNERSARNEPSYAHEQQPPPLPRHQPPPPHNSHQSEQYPYPMEGPSSSTMPPVPTLIANVMQPEAPCNTDAAHYSPDEQDSGVETPSTSEKPLAQLRELPTPCLSGIKNLGNTCYINAVLQCLSSTDSLSEYLVTERFARDLEDQTYAQQKISRQYGTNGAATRSLANFLQRLWFNRYDESVSRDFKALLGQFSADYRTSSQQDAQEFLVWLLDKVHEDLNTATKRTYRQASGKMKGSEEDLAEDARVKHRKAHCSYVTDLFEGQFRSSVWCPECHNTKLNFDPYMCISLPVPQDTKKPLFVTMVFWNRRPRLLKLGLNADATAKLVDVKNCLKQAASVNPHEVVLCDLSESGFRCVFPDATDVIALGSADKMIYAIETPPVTSPSGALNDRMRPPGYESSQSSPDEIIVIFCNIIGNEVRSTRRGCPFSLRISREMSYEQLCRRMLAMSRPVLRKHVDINDVPLSSIRVRVADEYAAGVYLDGGVTMPLYTQNVDNALNYGNRAYAGPQTLRLVMEWDVSTQNLYLDEANEPVLDHQSCADLVEEMKAPAATLMQCFKEYTQTETLEEWRCDSCKHKQRRAEKSLKFRSLPEVLVIHLKRFKHQADGETIKLDPTVQFPIDSLDLSVFMYHSGTTPVPHRKANGFYQQNRPTTHQSGRNNSHNGWQGRKRPPSGNANGRQTDQYLPPGGALYVNTEQNQNLYDLFAVVNHKGESINSGHYTAFCRNPVDSQWRHFDDTIVEKVEPKKVISNNAYLLFYERRGTSRATTCRNSSESGFSDHWFYRLPARVAHKYLSQAQLNGGVSSATTPRPSRPDTPASTIDDSEATAFSRTEPARNPHSPTHRPFTPTGMKSARSNGDIRKPPVPLPRPSLANANANQPPPSINAQLLATLAPSWPSSNNNRTLLSPQRKEQHIKSCSAIETDL